MWLQLGKRSCDPGKSETWKMDGEAWATVRDVEDHLGSLATWPLWSRDLCLSEHLSYLERATITGFLIGNKLPPLTFAVSCVACCHTGPQGVHLQGRWL